MSALPTITVNPTPAVTAPLSQVVCNGASTALVAFSGTGTSYSWVNNTPNIGIAHSWTPVTAAFRAASSSCRTEGAAGTARAQDIRSVGVGACVSDPSEASPAG